MHATAIALKFQSIDTDTHALVHLLCYYLLATPAAHKPIRPAPQKVSASWERPIGNEIEQGYIRKQICNDLIWSWLRSMRNVQKHNQMNLYNKNNDNGET